MIVSAFSALEYNSSPVFYRDANVLQFDLWHPALHNFITERRECFDRPGIMWPSLACLGSCGRSSSHVCVDDTEFPSGMVTCSGFIAGWTFIVGASGTRK